MFLDSGSTNFFPRRLERGGLETIFEEIEKSDFFDFGALFLAISLINQYRVYTANLGGWGQGGGVNIFRKMLKTRNSMLFHRGNRLETLWALLKLLRMASTGCKPDLGKIPKNIDSQNIFVRIQRILRIS